MIRLALAVLLVTLVLWFEGLLLPLLVLACLSAVGAGILVGKADREEER